jgi:hypothetical protein
MMPTLGELGETTGGPAAATLDQLGGSRALQLLAAFRSAYPQASEQEIAQMVAAAGAMPSPAYIATIERLMRSRR